MSRKLLLQLAISCLFAIQPVLAAVASAHPPREETYTITSVLQVLHPVRPEDMTDDFQDVRQLASDKDSVTLEVTYYPLFQQAVPENANWRSDDAQMVEYLHPTPTENWDDALRHDLLAELQKDGIEPDQLTDRQLVEKVSSWAMRRSHSTDHFAVWTCAFDNGQAEILPALRDSFDQRRPDQKWTPAQTFDEELLGKSMFYKKVHGSCTSSSIYMATILRALGIPTRIIFCIPPFDPNDPAQATLFYTNVKHNRVRETVRAALDGEGGFCNHLFNEVFIGHQWIRLNYNTLGQPILDRHYFGLLTHIYTCTDLSQVPLARTWGMRYFHYPADQPRLSSINPYRLISIHDHFGSSANQDNPQVPLAEFRTVTVDGLFLSNSPKLPNFFHTFNATPPIDLFISYKERVSAAHPMRTFYKRAGHTFVLKAPNCPLIKATWAGASVSAEGVETCGLSFDAGEKSRLQPGAVYTIEPVNVSDIYRWQVAPEASLAVPK